MKICIFLCLACLFSLTAQGQALNLLLAESEGVQLGDTSPAWVDNRLVVERLVGGDSEVWSYDLVTRTWHDLGLKKPIKIIPFKGQAIVLSEEGEGLKVTLVKSWEAGGIDELAVDADDVMVTNHAAYFLNNMGYEGSELLPLDLMERYDGQDFEALSGEIFYSWSVHQPVICDWADGQFMYFTGGQSGSIRMGYGFESSEGHEITGEFSNRLYLATFSRPLILAAKGDYCLIYMDEVDDSNFLGAIHKSEGTIIEGEHVLSAYRNVLSVGDFYYATNQDQVVKIDTSNWQIMAEATLPNENPGLKTFESNLKESEDLNIEPAVLYHDGQRVIVNSGSYTAVFDENLNPLSTPVWSPVGGTLSDWQSSLSIGAQSQAFLVYGSRSFNRYQRQLPFMNPDALTAGLGVVDQGVLKLFYGQHRLEFGRNLYFNHQHQGRLVQATDRYTGRKGIYQLSNTPAIGQFINGAWYDPELANQGLAIHQGKRTDGSEYLFLTAYLFKGGAPLWLAGVGEILAHNAESITFDLYEFDGLNFLQPGQAANQTTFGSIKLSLSDCNTLDIELDDGNNTHALNMYRANDTTYRELCQ